MSVLTDIADWFTKKKNQNYAYFADWAVANKDHMVFSYGISTLGVITGMAFEFGAGYADILRLGTGVQKGGWGYGQDALRIVSLAGPAAKGIRVAGKYSAQLYTNVFPRAPVCSYVSTAQAFRHTGNRLWMKVEDLAKIEGLHFVDDVVPGRIPTLVNMVHHKMGAQMASVYRYMGVPARAITLPSTGKTQVVIDALEAALKSAPKGSVATVSLKFLDGPMTRKVGHQVYVFLNSSGQLRLMDRYGEHTGLLAKSFLDAYKATGISVNGAALVMTSGFVRNAGRISLAVPVLRTFVGSGAQLDASYNTWASARNRASLGALPNPMSTNRWPRPPGGRYTVQVGDSLWWLAQGFMGNGGLWPSLYRPNQGAIGRDPATLRPGTVIRLPK